VAPEKTRDKGQITKETRRDYKDSKNKKVWLKRFSNK
jgi:hypothetical protein